MSTPPTNPSSQKDALQAFRASMPFARFLDYRCEIRGDEMTGVLPFQDKIIGNAALPALHGGAIGAFLEITAMAQIFLLSKSVVVPKPVDISIDYLRSGRARDTYARAEVTRMGRRVANVRALAWQEARDEPIAALHAHFILPDS